LIYKLKENALFVIDDLNIKSPKTKEFVSLLENLKHSNKKTLFLLGEVNENAVLSSKNVLSSKVINIVDLNTYDILNAESVVLLENSVSKLENILS
jgi:large subunit ribosomal protein L4